MTIRLSTTTLEAYRKIVHEEFGTEEELIASIKGKPFEPTWKMNAGRAWHELLADSAVEVVNMPGVTDDQRHELLSYRPKEGNVKLAWMRVRLTEARPIKRGGFSFSENAIALGRAAVGPGGVWEVKGTRTLTVGGHEVVLVAQADHWRGLHLSDAKATWSSPSLAEYEPNLQWRSYLLCHGAESFTFHKFCFREPKGTDGFCELREHLKTTFWAYPDLESDLKSWISEFVSWASSKGLLGYLQRENSTPVFEDAA